MNQPDFNYHKDGDVLCIIDEDRGACSVTNGIEDVMNRIHKETNTDYSDKYIVYRDSVGQWDGVCVRNTGTMERPYYELQTFVSLGACSSKEKAISLVKKFWPGN